ERVAVHTDFEMIVVEVSKAEGTDERRRIGMLADLTADDTGTFNTIEGRFESSLRTDGDGVARRAAGRRFRLDAWQIQSNNVLAGFNVSMARRAIGVCPLRHKPKPHDFCVEFLCARQVAHGKGYVVKCFCAKHFFPPLPKCVR